MSMINYRALLPQVAATVGVSLPPDWSGIDVLLPLLEKMRLEGAVVLLKFDGERTERNDTGPYTAAVTGTVMGEDFCRIDAYSMEDALSRVIVHYAHIKWGFVDALL
jgi:hypothetical protein